MKERKTKVLLLVGAAAVATLFLVGKKLMDKKQARVRRVYKRRNNDWYQIFQDVYRKIR